MINDKEKALIHRAIDGELAEAEKIEFQNLLEASPEARRFYQQIDSLGTISSKLSPVDAPAGLKPGVLRAIDHSCAPVKKAHSSPRAIGALIGALLTPRLAYGLAAGLIIGITASAIVLENPVGQLDPLDISGTLLGGKESKGLQRVDADSFAEGQASGRLAVDAGSGLTYIQLALESTQEVSIVVEYDPSGYILRAFEQASPVANSIVTGQGQLRAVHLGKNHYVFVLERVGNPTLPVICRVESKEVIYQRELQL